ncbi:MAG TPA: DUF4105 domain-containing protein, partial [bacterium]|nr:DUF4105 domain-containing protein [bacterium]
HARLATAAYDGDVVTVSNVRRFDHCPSGGGAVVERWETRKLDLSALDSVWLVLSPFERERRGPAHPFLSFGFGDTAFVSVSVEARRERDESYSIWRGMAKEFETIYVVADERDVITLRVLCRDDNVYLYPLRVSSGKAAALFREMLGKVNRLAERPEFYHTLLNNCAGAVLAHANRVAEEPLPGGWRILLPGFSDEIVYSQGLVDAGGTLEEIRARFLVNDRVRAAAGRTDLSSAVRAGLRGSGDGNGVESGSRGE